MLILAVGAVLAAEPVLASDGWRWLGPVQPGGDRDAVVFDPADCAVTVEAIDLDGGPANRDVRLARVWAEGAWRWADDWRVVDGTLRRPGRAPAPLDGLRFGEDTLRVDAEGRVTARARAGRVVEVLRDVAGAFRGMRSGPVEVRIDGDRGVASDGREVRWRRESGELRSVADGAGVRALYGYDGGRLARITWADGAAIVLEASGAPGARARTGATGVGGTWRCTVRADGRVAVDAPAGAWLVEGDGDARSVTDPSGAVTRTRWQAGRLVGWTDPRGGETRLARDDRGRVTEVTDPSGARWGLTWGAAGLVGVDGPDRAAWTLTRDAAGAVTGVTEPSGRSSRWEWDRAGGLRGVGVGAAWWAVSRDRAGRATAIVDPAGSRVEIARRPDGLVDAVRDGGGGAWIVRRDGRGAIVGVTDPGGGKWAITRDAAGRATAVSDPTGAETRWSLRADGLPERVVVAGRHVWTLLWTSGGALGGIRDPLGRTTGWARDGLGRARTVHRADGEAIAVDRDGAGEIDGVGTGVRVRRDAAGRPLAVDGVGIAWDRDAAGRVVGVSAPGVGLALGREPGGAVRELRVDGAAPVRLVRDAQGRVVRAEGEAPVAITRDAAGRVTAVDRPGGTIAVARDVRGLEARLTIGGRAWTFGRDGAGRVVAVEGPGGVRLGVDRDEAGRPRLVRFPTGALARLEHDGDEVRVVLADRDGRVQAEAGWLAGPTGAIDRLRAGVTWLLRRDPLGALVVAEAGEAVWSSAPDGVEGPDGAFVRYDAAGRPAAGRRPAGSGGAWGLGEGELAYVLDESGAVAAVAGDGGRVALTYDGIGRVTGWRGPRGEVSVRRDALGRLLSVAGTALEGWEGLLAKGGAVRAGMAGVGLAEPGGGVLLGPGGSPVLRVGEGVIDWEPQGGAAEATCGGRFAPGPGLPALGLLDAVDPVSGQPLAAGARWPWLPRAWEPAPSPSPWADPDGAAVVPWDDAPWAARSPWSDPLALLVAAGDLPDAGPRAARAPGVPWLPASFAPSAPAPVPDPLALPVEDEPLIAWILASARAPARAPAPSDVAAILLGAAVAPWLDLPPGLAPDLPPELRAIAW